MPRTVTIQLTLDPDLIKRLRQMKRLSEPRRKTLKDFIADLLKQRVDDFERPKRYIRRTRWHHSGLSDD